MAYAKSIAFGLQLPLLAPCTSTEDIFKGQHHLNKKRGSSSLSAQGIRNELKYCLFFFFFWLLKSEHIKIYHASIAAFLKHQHRFKQLLKGVVGLIHRGMLQW